MVARQIVQVSLKHFDTRKAEIAAELWRAATEVGFFYLKDTGIDAVSPTYFLPVVLTFLPCRSLACKYTLADSCKARSNRLTSVYTA